MDRSVQEVHVCDLTSPGTALSQTSHLDDLHLQPWPDLVQPHLLCRAASFPLPMSCARMTRLASASSPSLSCTDDHVGLEVGGVPWAGWQVCFDTQHGRSLCAMMSHLATALSPFFISCEYRTDHMSSRSRIDPATTKDMLVRRADIQRVRKGGAKRDSHHLF